MHAEALRLLDVVDLTPGRLGAGMLLQGKGQTLAQQGGVRACGYDQHGQVHFRHLGSAGVRGLPGGVAQMPGVQNRDAASGQVQHAAIGELVQDLCGGLA